MANFDLLASTLPFFSYVLYGDDGHSLAVIEVKRTCVDPAKGRQQAKLYADLLEKLCGHRPVIFLTNGFETRKDDGQYFNLRFFSREVNHDKRDYCKKSGKRRRQTNIGDLC